ncbi:MAG: hypothetical protein LBF83_02360 [Spirochaetaceae bacterium]|nr:hypothetical protein [Spirochaetaceae bacterium]
MKQNTAALFAAGLLALCTLASCATASAPMPEWYQNTDAVYPRERFIAYEGRGGTVALARQNALADLAAYFEQEVRKEGTASIRMIEQQGAAGTAVEKTRRIEEAITVTVKRNLTAVRYAEDAWRHPATKEYVTVAYMDREEAWKVYHPQAQKAADTLTLLFYGAREEADPFTRALLLGKTEAYAAGEEFVTARSFAQGLHPARAAALFEEADAAMPPLSKEADYARRNAGVYLECTPDLDGLIRNAATAAFNDAGFPVANERRNAQAVCVIEVKEGLVPRPPGTGTFYRPSLTGKVTSLGNAGTSALSFTVEADQQSAIDPGLARSRAYTALAQALRDTLPGRLRE